MSAITIATGQPGGLGSFMYTEGVNIISTWSCVLCVKVWDCRSYNSIPGLLKMPNVLYVEAAFTVEMM